MAINKNFYNPTKSVEWGGQPVCDVRAVSPNDITRVLAEDGELVARLVELVEGDVRSQGVNPEGAAAYVEQNANRLFGHVLTQFPRLVAKVIAVAADEEDKSAVDAIMKWPIPLQFEIMREIAVLTFVDTDGFRKFLGNVMALAGSLGGQRQAIDRPVQSITEASDTAG